MKLTKKMIYKNMLEVCSKSNVLKNVTEVERTWRLNDLIYCLELLDYNCNIQVQINTQSGMYIPIDGSIPVYIPASLRSQMVDVVDLEIYKEDEDDEKSRDIYLLIVQEKGDTKQ